MSVSMTVHLDHCIRFPNKPYRRNKLQEQMIMVLYPNQSFSEYFNHYSATKHKGDFDQQ